MTSQDQGEALASLGREVSKLRKRIERHEQEHERATELLAEQAAERVRLREATRRYWVTTIATVVGSNVATVLVILAGHKGV